MRTLLRLFYREVATVDYHHIPSHGPVILAANHHNSLVDAMLLLTTLDRPVTVLAKAELFDHWLIGPFLHSMHAVPVHRRQESGDDPDKNKVMFATVSAVLRAGGVVLIFPEGRTQPQPVLLPLRTGAARILLGLSSAEAATVTMVPVGLIFHDPGTFRAARALIKAGPPVGTADLVSKAGVASAQDVRTLTRRLTSALRAQIIEAEDQYTLTLLEVLEEAWRQEDANGGESVPDEADPAASVRWRQRVMHGAAALAELDPDRVQDLRHRIDEYRAGLDEAGLTGNQLGKPYRPIAVVRFVVENLTLLTLGLPVALWGIVCHAVPYRITAAIVPRLDSTAEEEATDKLGVGLVIYPAAWVVEGLLVWVLTGTYGAVAFGLLLVPSGLLALAWRERLNRTSRQVRAFLRFLFDRDLHERLIASRQTLIGEVRAVADMAPVELE